MAILEAVLSGKWRPRLPGSSALPLHKRLLDAIEADIDAGRLAPGARLPPQRELAHALAISVGAVTRAYEEAALRGLVRAHVGRGTFVAGASAAGGVTDGDIDLSVNIAPAVEASGVMSAAIASLRKVASLRERLNYLPPWGLEADRRAGAQWLRDAAGLDVGWERVICCTGAQAAMAAAVAATCRPGDTILCEAVTFPGMKRLASALGCRLAGVGMDGEGVRPQALDRVAARTGARVFYAQPTLQNPTARIAGRDRRAAIVKVARARDLCIIEDDVYALYARSLGVPPLAELAPERTVYLTSLSKTLSPGLRVGFLVPPDGDAFSRCIGAVRALQHSPPGLGFAVAADWIGSGQAMELANRVCGEVRARTELALTALGPCVERPLSGASLHVWMPLSEARAERLAGRALRKGVRLSLPGAQGVDGADAPTGLRLCIGAAADRAALERALSILLAADKDDSGDADAEL